MALPNFVFDTLLLKGGYCTDGESFHTYRRDSLWPNCEVMSYYLILWKMHNAQQDFCP